MATAIAFALRNWRLIAGGLAMLGLTVALMLAKADARHWQKLDELHVAQRDTEIAKHAVTRSSLNQALAFLDQKNAETIARSEAYDSAKAKDAATIASLDNARKATAQRIAGLDAISRSPDSCVAPTSLKTALEGL